MATSSDARVEQLAFLRGTFPDWTFNVRFALPTWRAERALATYIDRDVAVTELHANDPDALAKMLLRICDMETETER